MSFDPNTLKQLIATFKVELDEKTQLIVNGILTIEKENISQKERECAIADIFRSAHNIKGSARSLNINHVADIAHNLESLFSAIDKKTLLLNTQLIDLTLESVDKIKLAMNAFINKKQLPYDLNDLINRLRKSLNIKFENNVDQVSTTTSDEHDDETVVKTEESIRVNVSTIDRISAYMEDMQANKIGMLDQQTGVVNLLNNSKKLHDVWRQVTAYLKSQSENEINDHLQKLYYSGNDYFMSLTDSLNQLDQNMRLHLNNMNNISIGMQDEIRTLRLVPASTLFSTFPRYVRDLAHELNKKIDFTVVGDDLKIDNIILEKLKDPIIHLLRNSVDHGIETNETRLKANKFETGHIYVEIKEKEGQVCIAITDDGIGIDLNHVASVALEKKIVTQLDLDLMTPNDILMLIFRYGFSTKKMITDTSGRGIGLDVVKINIEKMNGTIKLDTKQGEYTTFELRVPLTLSSERGLLLQSGQQLFVIPTNSVKRVMAIKADNIIDIEGGQAIMVDDHPVPFCALTDVFGFEASKSANQNNLSIVVLSKSWKSVALLVDDVIGEREIVIKPLQSPLSSVPCVAGGTLYGNNQVIAVLDPSDLIDRSLLIDYHYQLTIDETKSIQDEKPHILVVDDSITTRALEKNILESKNYQVTVAVNGKEAWDILQKQLFSLIITDVSMPIMDGFTLTEKIKQHDKFKQIPIIIVTSLGSDEEKKKGLNAGANAYIIKNEFESSALLQVIEQLL